MSSSRPIKKEGEDTQMLRAVLSVPLPWRHAIKSIHLLKKHTYYQGTIVMSVMYADSALPHCIHGYEIGVSIVDQAELLAQGVHTTGYAHISDIRFICKNPEQQFAELQLFLGPIKILRIQSQTELSYTILREVHEMIDYNADTITRIIYGTSIFVNEVNDKSTRAALYNTLSQYLKNHKE